MGGAARPPQNAHQQPGACAFPAGLQGAPPAHFAEGEAEMLRTWDTCPGEGGVASCEFGVLQTWFKSAYAYTT